jgi:hypothetical protein
MEMWAQAVVGMFSMVVVYAMYWYSLCYERRGDMAALLVSRRVVLTFRSYSWKSRITNNNSLAIRCDLQCRRNFSFKLLSKLSKNIKKQLADVKILSNLRVS